MARKRQEGVTTLPRYKGKMYAVGYGIFAGNEELAREYAEALSHARSQGFGIYRVAYQEIKPILMRNGVPSTLWGLYKAFVNELINKVQRKKIATVEDIIDKWVKGGLDEGVLRDCAEAVVQIVEAEASTPAEKVA